MPGRARLFARDVPGIHVFQVAKRKTWMAGTSPAMTMNIIPSVGMARAKKKPGIAAGLFLIFVV